MGKKDGNYWVSDKGSARLSQFPKELLDMIEAAPRTKGGHIDKRTDAGQEAIEAADAWIEQRRTRAGRGWVS